MIMIADKDYSKIRGHLTNAIRQIEQLSYISKIKHRPMTYHNEYEYWLSSLSLLRNCLYNCDNTYDGQINIGYAVAELHSELTNFIKIIKELEPSELDKLDKAWKHLKEIEEMLN